MRLGFAIPQVGYEAGVDSTSRFAASAERVGYQSLWVLDRLLFPLSPSQHYPASADGKLPEAYKRVLDPLTLLSFVAAKTDRTNLGTSILNLAWYNPTLLARQLATIDVLSNGRLRVGVGTGWSPEEYEAAGIDWRTRGRRTDESIELMREIWSERYPSFSGAFNSVPASVIDLKPVQQRVPIYMAAYSTPAMKRIAEKGDGWMPAGIPLAAMAQMFAGIKQMAEETGRDPNELQIIVRANITVLPKSIGGNDRVPFVGSLEEIWRDISDTRELGVDELLFDAQFSPDVTSLSALSEKLEQLYEIASR